MVTNWIGNLYGKHAGADIYIVGTGTSLRVFPTSFFEDKITIGLNQAWKIFPTTYCITSVPEFNIPEFIDGEQPRPNIIWITKQAKLRDVASRRHSEFNAERVYFFENNVEGQRGIISLDEIDDTGRNLDWVRTPDSRKLYLWTSISQAALNLAANMGAKNIILAGCDNAALGENHHAHDQHTMWRGDAPEVRYLQYYEGLSEIREVLRKRQVNVVAINPFLKLDNPELDFRRLCGELGQQDHIASVDVARGHSLADDNRRYWKLTWYMIKKNLRALFGIRK